jgi:hypothetical protein
MTFPRSIREIFSVMEKNAHFHALHPYLQRR